MLKLSGEALAGAQGYGIDPATLQEVVSQLQEIQQLGVQIGVVLGGGNIFRGISAQAQQMERSTADQVGMLATVMNSLMLAEGLRAQQVSAAVFSAIEVRGVVPLYQRRHAIAHLESGGIAIFAGGTGNPFFTTDTAAALRAREIEAGLLLKATQVDGVYSADPRQHPKATRYKELTYLEVLERDLRVMDATAISFCREYALPIVVFDLKKRGNIKGVVLGQPVGTWVGEGRRPGSPSE